MSKVTPSTVHIASDTVVVQGRNGEVVMLSTRDFMALSSADSVVVKQQQLLIKDCHNVVISA